MLSPANGVGSVEGTIKVDSTLSNTLRSTELRFQGANGQSRKLTITQFGYGKQIFLKEPVVEILRGPASMLYGSNAMGGVVNIVTRRMREDGIKTSLHAGYGSYNTLESELTNRIRKGRFSST